jgi:hypothetical protein
MAINNLAYTSTVARDYAAATGISNVKFDETAFNQLKDVDFSKAFVGGAPDYGGDLLASPPGSGGGEAWVFITAPGSVQWNVSADVQRIDIFGTNSPPVTASSRGMRDLQLTEALMEGFTLGKAVQNELDQLEKLMNVEVNSQDGFVSVPVYDVKAGGKSYGLYVIESIDIDEQMRDLQGRATRAMVGVSLKQVPLYQVGNGIDQAGSASGGQALDASKFTQADKQAANVAQNSTSTPAATAQNVDGVNVPAGATNIRSSTDAKGVTTVSYRVNGVTKSVKAPK